MQKWYHFVDNRHFWQHASHTYPVPPTQPDRRFTLPHRPKKHWTTRAHILILEVILLAAALIEGVKYLLFLIRSR